ncbi:hypothetical protein [Desulfovibrio sp. TomC]|uniref:hypothetical protein n=1 Tax=Desulfovibrio sp. TomC TaxID=1562888 RepID=UPI0012E2C0FB|nr:hypothetical protein [Desulfovibrio sp. TomC]
MDINNLPSHSSEDSAETYQSEIAISTGITPVRKLKLVPIARKQNFKQSINDATNEIISSDDI